MSTVSSVRSATAWGCMAVLFMVVIGCASTRSGVEPSGEAAGPPPAVDAASGPPTGPPPGHVEPTNYWVRDGVSADLLHGCGRFNLQNTARHGVGRHYGLPDHLIAREANSGSPTLTMSQAVVTRLGWRGQRRGGWSQDVATSRATVDKGYAFTHTSPKIQV
jgi:hypothetical protein